MEDLDRRGVVKSARASAAHALLFTFTIVVVLKLHHSLLSFSWWVVFTPLWLFHLVVAQGRFSIPSPSYLDAGPYDPFHAVVATPLLIAFELLLCIHLEGSYVENLNVVFIPIYLLGSIIIIDNIRMCYPMYLVEMEFMVTPKEFEPAINRKFSETTDLSIYYLTVLSMVFILASTGFTVTVINGTDSYELDFWIPSIGQLLAYFVIIEPALEKEEYEDEFRLIVGTHIMIVSVYGFQVLLFIYLRGIPERVRDIPIPYIFSPLFFLQGLGVVFSTSQLVERIYLLMRRRREVGKGRYFELSSRARGFLEFMHHGSRFLGWWSIDEASKEAKARRIHHDYVSRGSEFLCYEEIGCNPPDLVKRVSKKDLIDEVLALQAAIRKQINVTESTQQEHESLRNEKILCRICFETEIEVVLLPCKHRLFCRQCCWRLRKCPYCLASVHNRLLIRMRGCWLPDEIQT